MSRLLAFLALCIFPLVSVASPQNNQIRGYHWYVKPPAEEEKKPERQELPDPPPKSEMMKMHPDDLSVLLKNYEKEAVWKLTPKTVKNYYEVRDVVRRKALAFAAVSSFTAMTTPAMSANYDAQGGMPGEASQTALRASEIDATILQSRNDYAVAFFTTKTCPFCPKQRQVLNALNTQYAIPIKEIDIVENPAAAEEFNVTRTPVTIIIKRGTDKWLPLSTGLTGLMSIRKAMFRSVRYLDGKITPEQFFMYDYQKGGVMDTNEFDEEEL